LGMLEPAEAVVVLRAQVGVGSVVFGVGVGIAGQQGEAVREALLQPSLQGVVLGATVRGEQADARINKWHGAAGSKRGVGIGRGISLVAVIESEQLSALGAGIANLQHGVSAQLALDAEIPLLNVA